MSLSPDEVRLLDLLHKEGSLGKGKARETLRLDAELCMIDLNTTSLTK